MEELTDKQRNVLEFITEFFRDNEKPPTLSEISAYIGTKGTVSALRHIEVLERKGFINRKEGSSREIVIKKSGNRTVPIPVAGTVKAGIPSLAINDIEHTKTKVRLPQTNGICERFHKKMLPKFY